MPLERLPLARPPRQGKDAGPRGGVSRGPLRRSPAARVQVLGQHRDVCSFKLNPLFGSACKGRDAARGSLFAPSRSSLFGDLLTVLCDSERKSKMKAARINLSLQLSRRSPDNR